MDLAPCEEHVPMERGERKMFTKLARLSDARASSFSDRTDEAGMATAELLGNAALGIAALVAIWAVLQAVGLDVMEWIRAQLQV
jgi:hypothetical protein